MKMWELHRGQRSVRGALLRPGRSGVQALHV